MVRTVCGPDTFFQGFLCRKRRKWWWWIGWKMRCFMRFIPSPLRIRTGTGSEISRGSSTIWIIFRSWAAMPSGWTPASNLRFWTRDMMCPTTWRWRPGTGRTRTWSVCLRKCIGGTCMWCWIWFPGIPPGITPGSRSLWSRRAMRIPGGMCGRMKHGRASRAWAASGAFCGA